MSNLIRMLEDLKAISDFSEKKQLLGALIHFLNNKSIKPREEDKRALDEFAFSEVKKLLVAIPEATSYREKDDMCACEDSILGIIMMIHPSPDEIPSDNMYEIQLLVELVNKERFLENEIDCIFEGKQNSRSDVERMINAAKTLTDEYHRGMVFQGLFHYRERIQELPEESKAVLGEYITSEMQRCLSGIHTDDVIACLEMACDVAKYFMSDLIIELLYKAVELNRSNISYFAIDTLLSVGRSVPEDTIISLANDIVYADITYHLLKRYGLTSLFPNELATPEHLAKSDLVHWLTYPTELGKLPDAIEYLGKVDKKGEDYYIFRYMSDSDNLGDSLKGKWLIGWSNVDGGTFSNFDLYSDYEQKTVEKTLKHIKKKLL